jgi:acyl carrier protein
MGMSDYVMANAYLDGRMAQLAATTPVQALSLQWVGWSDVGMHSTLDEHIEQKVRRGMGAVGLEFCDQTLGKALFAGVLQSGARGVLMPTPIEPHRFGQAVDELLLGPPPPAADELDLSDLTDEELDQLLSVLEGAAESPPVAERAESRDDLVSLLMGVLAEVMRLEPDDFDARSEFSSVGLDSISAAKMVQRIQALTGLQLAAEDLFSYPSAVSLAAFLEAEPATLATGAAER